jgi:hypothetical protein
MPASAGASLAALGAFFRAGCFDAAADIGTGDPTMFSELAGAISFPGADAGAED